MADDKPETLICTIVAVDSTNDFSYLVCSVCEKPLHNPISPCNFCNRNAFNSSSFPSKRLFRLLVHNVGIVLPKPGSNSVYITTLCEYMSIASDTKVFRVICFDRAAKVLLGCSAGEFFDFAKLHPFAAANAGRILEGEMCRMTLAKPKNGNAQHLRVASVVPLSSGFQPVIQSLKEHYGVH